MKMMWGSPAFVRTALVGVPVAMLLWSCSVNPATGKSQIALISESQEIAMGREADQQIVAQMGLYGDDEAQDYVQWLGGELAARSERPNLPWTFRVLDDPVVNAFALPGGYIYVTRGIMAHLNNEAELVSVLGHEIGHVTARHGVNQMSKQQLFGIGMGLGSILSPELASVANLASQGLGLLFLKYSRDDERQADELGLRYSVRGGWDPREGPAVFTVLRRVGEAAGASRIPSYMSTHPDPDARVRNMSAAIAAMDRDFEGSLVNRDAYMGRIDGMVFGPDPRSGYFEDGLFLHPELAFKMQFPNGWKTVNQRAVVAAVSQNGDAIMQGKLAEQEDPAAAAQAFADHEGVEAGRVRRTKVHGLTAATVEFAADTEQGRLHGLSGFIRYGQNTYQLLAFTSESKWSSYSKAAGTFIKSFDKVKDRRVLDIQPARVEVIALDRALPLETFNSRFPSSIPIETVALINHIAADGSLPAGEGAKRVTGGRSTIQP